MGEQRPLLVGHRNVGGALQPLHEARHRRQRHEIFQLRQFALQFLGHLLDQEAAEGNAGEAALGVGDRIEHRGAGALDRNRLAVLGEQRRDRAGDRFGQRHLDEDQGFVDQRGMKERVAAPVDGIDAAAQIVPVADLMHRLIADDLFQDVGGRRPVDPAQHEKAPVEPGGQQMRDVAVEPGKALVRRLHVKQIGAQRHQLAGGVRRAIEPAEQFLPPRFGSKMQVAGVVVARLRPPGLDGLRQLLPVRAVVAGQRLEERKPAGGVEVMIAVENLARHRGAGGLAAAGQQRLAQFDQLGGVLFGVRWTRRGAAGCGHARKSRRADRRKRRCSWRASRIQYQVESYTGIMTKPITIKRGAYSAYNKVA